MTPQRAASRLFRQLPVRAFASHGKMGRASLSSLGTSPPQRGETPRWTSASAPAATTLESRFDDLDQPTLLTGIQALVRVLLEQSRLDRLAGLNTGGLVSGYRGSPLGGLDQELWRRQKMLTERNIQFPTGRERRPGRDHAVRDAAARCVSRQARRWRVRHVVRQRTRRGSRRRRAALRQFYRHLEAWRRAGGIR